MSDVILGDRVSYKRLVKWFMNPHYEDAMGRVRAFVDVKGTRCAEIAREPFGLDTVPVDCLTVFTPAALVAAVAARELDDTVREGAISSLRWACDPIDYDLMMAAGDLGGAEIDLWDMTL